MMKTEGSRTHNKEKNKCYYGLSEPRTEFSHAYKETGYLCVSVALLQHNQQV